MIEHDSEDRNTKLILPSVNLNMISNGLKLSLSSKNSLLNRTTFCRAY